MKLEAIAAMTASDEAQKKIRAKGHVVTDVSLGPSRLLFTCGKCGMRFTVRPPAPPKRRIFVDSGWFLDGLGHKHCRGLSWP